MAASRQGSRRTAARRAAKANDVANGTVDTAELQELLNALRAAKRGELGVRLSTRKSGIVGELGRAFNELAATREQTTKELLRVSAAVGRDGKLTERARLTGSEGSWATKLEAVNALIDDLVRPTREVGRVLDAVAEGDLSQKMVLEIDGQPVKGEFARIGSTVNAMVGQLSAFAAEVTRVAREVGTEGKLGGQARVKGVSGVWKDLTDSVNQMASNLTAPGARHRGRHEGSRRRRPEPEGDRRRPGRGGGAQDHGQHDGRPARDLRRRGHARRPRGRQRGHPRRPGAGPRRVGRVARPDREREHARREPDQPGAQHRDRHDCGRERRPQPQDHRRRQGRGARAEGDHQHDGRPAPLVLVRGHARRARGRHRGTPRRPGLRRGRLGRLEGPHGQREHARRQPHEPGAEHRRGHDRRGPGRPRPQRSRSRPPARSPS